LNSAFNQCIAHCLVIRDVFAGDNALGPHLMLTSVEDSDFGGKIFCFQYDRRCKVGQRRPFGTLYCPFIA